MPYDRNTFMKKTLLILSILWLGHIEMYGQKNPTSIYGTVPIDNTSSMDATEVTINEWIQFVINNDFNKDYFPNSTIISNLSKLLFEDLKKQKDFEFIEVIKNFGLLRENYGSKGFKVTKKFKSIIEADTNYFSINNPIVGISFWQAQKFCEWREELVNRTKAIKIKVTLPSFEIYKKVNVNKDSLCKAELNCPNCQGYQINYLHQKCVPTSRKNKQLFANQGQNLLRADVYWPSILGLYNIQGNASEMTSEEGVAVGGSFRNYAKESYSDQVQNYKKEEDWLGFRCIITLQ
jgi:formylglycine-generating enzyme required for sulfatase activity